MKYAYDHFLKTDFYDPAKGTPEGTELEQEFLVTLTRRDVSNLMICVSQSLDMLRNAAAAGKGGNYEPAAHGLLATMTRLSHSAAQQYWRLHGHPENWQYRFTTNTNQGENQ